MTKDHKTGQGFLADLFGELARMVGILFIVFAIGAGAAAGVCIYYGIPLVLSLVGGFIILGVVLGIAIAFKLDSLFFNHSLQWNGNSLTTLVRLQSNRASD